MKSLNVAQLIPEQPEKLMHKLANYTMVNYDFIKEHIHWQIYKNYLYSMPIWLTILITALSTS